MAEAGEGFGCCVDGGGDGGVSRVVEQADAEALGRFIAQGDGRGEGVARVVAGEDVKKDFHVADGAGHGAGHAEEAAGVGNFREVAGGGDAAGGGLQAGDAAAVGGNTDGPAAVAADAAGRATGSNGRSFTAAGATGGAFKVPGVGRPASDGVIGFVVGEEFGAVGFAKDDGAGGAEALDGGGVVGGFVA